MSTLMLSLIVLPCLDWFWIQGLRHWRHPKRQRSFTASSMLTSPLSSLPSSMLYFFCLFRVLCYCRWHSPPTAHISLTAATHVVLPKSHLLLSYALYVTRLNQLDTEAPWRAWMLYFSLLPHKSRVGFVSFGMGIVWSLQPWVLSCLLWQHLKAMCRSSFPLLQRHYKCWLGIIS